MKIAVMNEASGSAHVVADRRRYLYDLCDALYLQRRSIRWSPDLHCHILIIKPDDRQLLRKILNENDKGEYHEPNHSQNHSPNDQGCKLSLRYERNRSKNQSIALGH
ncbi:hypothetical protein [Paenibacillus sp. NPDC057967]|uniref:hypothetical protein n=1 Tax=Paenibacillus sp. NPDC057967 TaxID=3346293 RepID=UPI0036DF85B3